MAARKLRRLLLADAAVDDLDELWMFIAEDNPVAADQYLNEVTERCRLLTVQPEIGRPRDELAYRLRSFAYKNHLIFYRVADGAIEVARILSGYRDLDELF